MEQGGAEAVGSNYLVPWSWRRDLMKSFVADSIWGDVSGYFLQGKVDFLFLYSAANRMPVAGGVKCSRKAIVGGPASDTAIIFVDERRTSSRHL